METGPVERPLILERFPEHARLIGLIIAAWNTTENTLVNLLAFSLHADAKIVAPMLYAIQMPRARLQAIEAGLLELYTGPTQGQEMKALLDEARAVLDRRNFFAHAVYGAPDDAKNPVVVSMKDVDAVSQVQSISELNKELARAKALMAHVVDLWTSRSLPELRTMPAPPEGGQHHL